VGEMLASMSMSEYVNWKAIYQTEPFPEERADLRTAEQLRMTLIAAGVKKIPAIADLIPDWWGEHKPHEQTPEQMKANLNVIKSAKRKSVKNAA
jgi:hypothetical protein